MLLLSERSAGIRCHLGVAALRCAALRPSFKRPPRKAAARDNSETARPCGRQGSLVESFGVEQSESKLYRGNAGGGQTKRCVFRYLGCNAIETQLSLSL